jgi:thiol-disulfide isomerase/thioredoxin
MSTFYCKSCGRAIFRGENIVDKRVIWRKDGFEAECYVVSAVIDLDKFRRIDDASHQGFYCCRFMVRRMTNDKYSTGDNFLVYTDSVTDTPGAEVRADRGTIELTEQDFDVAIASANPKHLLVVKFGASWCPPCRLLEAMFARIHQAGGIPLVQIFELDVDHEPQLRARWNFRSIPFTLFFRAGKQIDITGLTPHTASGGLNGAITDAAFRDLCRVLIEQPVAV